jgi:hypothetical protein
MEIIDPNRILTQWEFEHIEDLMKITPFNNYKEPPTEETWKKAIESTIKDMNRLFE